MSVRVLSSFQSWVSGKPSFSALMAARRPRTSSSPLSISLRASAAASRWAFRASSSWTLAGVIAGSTFGTMDSSKVLPCRLSAPFRGRCGRSSRGRDTALAGRRAPSRARASWYREPRRCPPGDELGFLPDDLGHEFAEGKVADVAVQVRDLQRLQRLLDLVDTLEQTLSACRAWKQDARGSPKTCRSAKLALSAACGNSCFRNAKLAEIP